MNEHEPGRHETDTERDPLARIIRAAGRRPAPSKDDYRDVLAATHAAWQRKVSRRRRRRGAYYAIAATLVVVAVGVAIVQQLGPTGAVASPIIVQGRVELLAPDARAWRPLGDTDAELTAGTALRTRIAGRAALGLPGGASLRIDADTTLVLESAERVALQRGRVYVDSGPGVQTRSFEIATAAGIVRDIGTQFEVATYDLGIRVRIREGRVELDRNTGVDLTGLAGEELNIDPAGRVERGGIAPDDPGWAWAETLAPAQQLDGRTAYEVLVWAARETGRELAFTDAAAERQARAATLSGGGRALAPADALAIAAAIAELDYAIEAGVIRISRLQ